MKANLGGTDVLKVLEKVAQCQPKPGQLRQILLLTGALCTPHIRQLRSVLATHNSL
jgi:hypothetical protein